MLITFVSTLPDCNKPLYILRSVQHLLNGIWNMSRAKQHQRTRSLYAKYGEWYNPPLPYQWKAFKISEYGQLLTTRPLPRPGKKKRDVHQKIKRFAEGEHAVPPTLALYGASITQGLRRYHEVWDTYFAPLGAINLGIGGDRTQHFLERMEDVQLPATVECVVVHCGTNNLANSKPSDIAFGVLAIGARAKLGRRKLKIIICEVLHCDLKKVRMMSIVAEVNTILIYFHILRGKTKWCII